MIRFPLIPEPFANKISGTEEQSAPQSIDSRILKIAGVGVAFTAKYSRNPGFQAKAL